MSWIDELTFTQPLQDVRGRSEAQGLAAELARELSQEHELRGCDGEVLAWALPRDDVFVRCGDHLVVVHLTWSGKTEPAPWPSAVFLASAQELQERVEAY